MRYNEFSVYI